VSASAVRVIFILTVTLEQMFRGFPNAVEFSSTKTDARTLSGHLKGNFNGRTGGWCCSRLRSAKPSKHSAESLMF